MSSSCRSPPRIQPIWWVSSKSSLSGITSTLETGEYIFLTNIYVPTDLHGKQKLWSHITFMCRLFPFHLWIMVGDFNAILDLCEKKDGVMRLEPSSILLGDSISTLNLVDIKSSNGLFTWNN